MAEKKPEEILAEAQAEAEKIVNEATANAKAEAKKAISEETGLLRKQSKEEALKTKEQAEKGAASIIAKAKEDAAGFDKSSDYRKKLIANVSMSAGSFPGLPAQKASMVIATADAIMQKLNEGK
jgi:vacuolar-type H+-ATPase subunit H